MAAANPNDVLRLGAQLASVKASMPKKRWASFVRLAHSRGHTIAGELTDGPAALKERTASSIRDEAQKTVATAYAPATQALSQRQAAIGYLDEKRKTDDAAYRQWLSGETDKLHAQAGAADATLATQQSTIAAETKTAIEAARADSLKRMAANPGNVSDPSALDTSAADTAATQHIAAARDQSAAITKIGGDSRELAAASLMAQQAAREGTRQADTWKALGEVAADRSKLTGDQAAALVDKTTSLTDKNVAMLQSNREADLAGASLGLKKDDLAASIADSTRKYNLETAKFGLDKWKADNADVVARAKLDLGYAGIASREGTAAAKRKLDEKLAKIRAAAGKDKADKADKPSIKQAERDIYDKVERAKALFIRWDKNNAVPLAEREQNLRDMGASQLTIDVAHELARNAGVLSNAGRIKARKLGLVHSAYFYPVAADYSDKPVG